MNRSTQRRFKWIVLSVLAIVAIVLTPLVVSGDLRLDLAHRFDLVPGGDVEQIAGPESGITLIVAAILPDPESGRREYRFRAAFLASTGGEGVSLEFIDSGRQLTLPIEAYDFYSNSRDGRHVLFQDRRNPNAIRGVLVNVDTGDVTEMPVESPYPTDIPGDWEKGSWEASIGTCGGISPHARFITCFQNPKLASYVAGDWELQVRVYSAAIQVLPVYRGIGFRPWAGWSNDDSRLYFQNEEGIWMAPIEREMFPK